MALFGGLLKPGEGGELALRRELERRVTTWSHTGYLYRGGGDYILKHGSFYQGRALPDEYADLQGPMAQCFWNALTAAKSHPDLRYCEGVYSTGSTSPTPHAWCVGPDDRLVEVTFPTRDGQWEDAIDMKGMPIMAPEHHAYMGVIFRTELMDWFSDTYGEMCMFDRPTADSLRFSGLTPDEVAQAHDWPILKVAYDPDRVSL